MGLFWALKEIFILTGENYMHKFESSEKTAFEEGADWKHFIVCNSRWHDIGTCRGKKCVIEAETMRIFVDMF